MKGRALSTTILLAAALVFYATAAAFPFATVNNAGLTRVDMSLWELCTTVVTTKAVSCAPAHSALFATCDAKGVYFMAARAFQISACVVCGFAMVMCVMYRLLLNSSNRATTRGIIVGSEFLAAAFSVLGWGVAVALYTESFCGGTPTMNLHNVAVGENQPLCVVGFVLNCVAFILEFVLDDDDNDSSSSLSSSSGDESITKTKKSTEPVSSS